MPRQGEVRYGPSGWEAWDDPMGFWLSEELLAERAPLLLKSLHATKAIQVSRPWMTGRIGRIYGTNSVGPAGEPGPLGPECPGARGPADEHEWRLDAQEQRLNDIPVQGRPEKPYRVIRVYDDCLTDAHGMTLTIEQLATLSEFADSLVTLRKRSDLLGAAFDPAKPVGMRVPRGTNRV